MVQQPFKLLDLSYSSSSYLSNSSNNRTRNVELDDDNIELDFEHSVLELDYQALLLIEFEVTNRALQKLLIVILSLYR